MSDATAVKKHWNNPDTVSMYDKLWAAQERRLILQYLPKQGRALDVGCGEGEGLAEYAVQRPGVTFIGVDYSSEQLLRARVRCGGYAHFLCMEWPPIDEPRLGSMPYDCVMSTRFVINILDRQQQCQAIKAMADRVKPGGMLLLMEGSLEGHYELNAVRLALGLKPIAVREHNLFLSDDYLEDFARDALGLHLGEKRGFGSFFMLTRGLKPFFTGEGHGFDDEWNHPLNIHAASPALQRAVAEDYRDLRCSRVRLWVFEKP